MSPARRREITRELEELRENEDAARLDGDFAFSQLQSALDLVEELLDAVEGRTGGAARGARA